jgi:hypothetical protein
VESDDLIAADFETAGGPLRDRPFVICERYVSQIMQSMHLHVSRDPA